MGVEPTTRLAKSRITGFEGREDHRTPFASAVCNKMITKKFSSCSQVRQVELFGSGATVVSVEIRATASCRFEIEGARISDS